MDVGSIGFVIWARTWAGLDQPPRHVRAHIAETDEADVHDDLPDYLAPAVAGMNSARIFSLCSPSRGHRTIVPRALRCSAGAG